MNLKSAHFVANDLSEGEKEIFLLDPSLRMQRDKGLKIFGNRGKFSTGEHGAVIEVRERFKEQALK